LPFLAFYLFEVIRPADVLVRYFMLHVRADRHVVGGLPLGKE
jgi:hypothetical protein